MVRTGVLVVILAVPTSVRALDRSCEHLVDRVVAGDALTTADVKGAEADCRLMLRNAPFARHGRPFKHATIRAFFERHTWYRADTTFTDDRLDATDRANVQLVLTTTMPFDLVWALPFDAPPAGFGAEGAPGSLRAVDDQGNALVYDSVHSAVVVVTPLGEITAYFASTGGEAALGKGRFAAFYGSPRADTLRVFSAAGDVIASGAIPPRIQSVYRSAQGTLLGRAAHAGENDPDEWLELSDALATVGSGGLAPASAIVSRPVKPGGYRVRRYPQCLVAPDEAKLPEVIEAFTQDALLAAGGGTLRRISRDGTTDLWTLPQREQEATSGGSTTLATVAGFDASFYSLVRTSHDYQLLRWRPDALPNRRVGPPPSNSVGAPTFDGSSSSTFRVGQKGTTEIRAQDPTGALVRFYVLGTPATVRSWRDASSNILWLEWTPTKADVGQHSITLTADGACGTASKLFTLSVVE